MPIRREIRVSGTIRVLQSKKSSHLRALVLGVLALTSIPAAFGQETPKPQAPTPTGNSSTGEPSDRASKVPGVALYNFLQNKSIVFPRHCTGYGTTFSGSEVPVVRGQQHLRAHHYLGGSRAPSVGQADDSPTGFGQGWDAYAQAVWLLPWRASRRANSSGLLS